MKKLMSMMIVFALAIAAVTALAEPATYTDRDGDFTFTYDADMFEIVSEEYQSDDDDNLVLVLGGKVEAWGNVFTSSPASNSTKRISRRCRRPSRR